MVASFDELYEIGEQEVRSFRRLIIFYDPIEGRNKGDSRSCVQELSNRDKSPSIGREMGNDSTSNRRGEIEFDSEDIFSLQVFPFSRGRKTVLQIH